MKHILFNRQFVNAAETDLVAGKIHTIRENYGYWEMHEGQEVALAYWMGKPYHSNQKVFCTKKIISVEKIIKMSDPGGTPFFRIADRHPLDHNAGIHKPTLAKNDGFQHYCELEDWFREYPNQPLAVIHFTDFKYAA